jgi:ketosteroid isomerase-like protein
MSDENVEIVRRIFDAWSTGDFGAGLADLDGENTDSGGCRMRAGRHRPRSG